MRTAQVTMVGDEFGNYLLTIACRQCQHKRISEPHALALLTGWEISLATFQTPAVHRVRRQGL